VSFSLYNIIIIVHFNQVDHLWGNKAEMQDFPPLVPVNLLDFFIVVFLGNVVVNVEPGCTRALSVKMRYLNPTDLTCFTPKVNQTVTVIKGCRCGLKTNQYEISIENQQLILK